MAFSVPAEFTVLLLLQHVPDVALPAGFSGTRCSWLSSNFQMSAVFIPVPFQPDTQLQIISPNGSFGIDQRNLFGLSVFAAVGLLLLLA